MNPSDSAAGRPAPANSNGGRPSAQTGSSNTGGSLPGFPQHKGKAKALPNTAVTHSDREADNMPTDQRPTKKRRVAEDTQAPTDSGPSKSAEANVEENGASSSEEGTQSASEGHSLSNAKPAKISARKHNKQILTAQASTHLESPKKDCDILPKPSRFCALPLELLAEILIYTGSPQHVLAVARSCKFMCDTLLGINARFIWRAARHGSGCSFEKEVRPEPQWQVVGGFAVQVPAAAETRVEQVYIPDPHRRFTEAAYAAYLFDPGQCDVCKKTTSAPYISFSLQIRRCKSYHCISDLSGFTRLEPFFPANQVLMTILSVNECDMIPRGRGSGRPSFWPYGANSQTVYAKSDEARAAAEEYQLKHNDAAYQQKCKVAKEKQEEWMKFCVKLSRWRFDFDEKSVNVEVANLKTAKSLSSKYGWNHEDFIGATFFGPLQRLKTKCLELVSETDIKTRMEEMDEALLGLEEKRERRQAEISLMENRKDVETLYNRLRSQKTHRLFPSLPTFRRIPVVALLQSGELDGPRGKTPLANTLQNNPTMKDLLEKQIEQWVAKAKQELAATLGFGKNWKTANKNILHPVERVTARFQCTKCKRVESKYKTDECLDFAGACKHICFIGSTKKQRTDKKASWNPTVFVKDDKAIEAVRKCINAMGHNEDRDSGNYMSKVDFAVVCTSCNPPMVLDSRSVVGHSHRHEDMQMSFTFGVKQVEHYLGGLPYEHGLVEKLVHSNNARSNAAKAEIAKKNYGCRHCLRMQQVEASASAANAAAMIVDPNAHDQSQPADNQPHQPVHEGPGHIQLSAVVHRMHEVQVSGPREKPPVLFIFNGLRSHLKSKHGIEDIRDEDVFCWDPVNI